MNNADLICEATIKAVIDNIVSVIPLGGVLIDVHKEICSLQSKRKQERLEELYCALKDDIETIKEKINHVYTNQPDFLDIFELTAKYTTNERVKEKRILFKNILLNSISTQNCSYDKTEKYLSILERMGNLELQILNVLRNPSEFNRQKGEIINDPNWIRPGVRNGIQFTTTYKFLELLSKLISVSEEDVADAMHFLEGNRLVLEQTCSSLLKTNGHPIRTLEDKLTSKGNDFFSFLLQVK